MVESAATDIADTPHIRVEAVVWLVAAAYNWNSLEVLSRRLLWLVLHQSLLASNSSIVERRRDSRWVIL